MSTSFLSQVTASDVIKHTCGIVSFAFGVGGVYDLYNGQEDKQNGTKKPSTREVWNIITLNASFIVAGITTPYGIWAISGIARKILSDATCKSFVSSMSSFEMGKVGWTLGMSGTLLALPMIVHEFCEKEYIGAGIFTLLSVIAPIGLHYAGKLAQVAKSYFIKA